MREILNAIQSEIIEENNKKNYGEMSSLHQEFIASKNSQNCLPGYGDLG